MIIYTLKAEDGETNLVKLKEANRTGTSEALYILTNIPSIP